jgi:poly(ADP-ribose) glycohydrolase ARH3
MQAKLEALVDGVRQEDADEFVIARVGNRIRASEAVAAALWAFLRYGQTPEECVIRAVNFGGDTDTIGAMAGALAGALHGTAWIPARWREMIENGKHGREVRCLVVHRAWLTTWGMPFEMGQDLQNHTPEAYPSP